MLGSVLVLTWCRCVAVSVACGGGVCASVVCVLFA